MHGTGIVRIVNEGQSIAWNDGRPISVRVRVRARSGPRVRGWAGHTATIRLFAGWNGIPAGSGLEFDTCRCRFIAASI